MVDPARYIPSQQLLDALNTAILLGQPLLVTGEPGSGKTEVAHFLAYRLGLERYRSSGEVAEFALRFDTKSTVAAKDIFYSVDNIARFHAANTSKSEIDVRRYITLHALGRAIVDAADSSVAEAVWGANYHRGGGPPRRSVVLIDEIDKAPRDVPNDLLMEIEKMKFYLNELDITVEASADYRPIVVMTSNSERSLPDAFLRRCAFFFMEFPSDDRLRDIVANRLPQFPIGDELLEAVLHLFRLIRDMRLVKPPGTAELLAFASALVDSGVRSREDLRQSRKWFGMARVCLFKTTDDQALVTDALLYDLVRG